MDPGIIYPDYVDSVKNVAKIRGLLLDVNLDPLVQLAYDLDRWKLSQIGTLYRNARLGTAFGRSRESAPAGKDFELRRI